MQISSVFKRTRAEGDLVDNVTYNVVIGMVLCWGFFINWVIVSFVDYSWLSNITIKFYIIIFITYIAFCILGIYLFYYSTNPVISFIGYNLIVVPFGLVVNLVVNDYAPNLVIQAIRTTASVTVMMMIFSSLYPKFFQKTSSSLATAFLLVFIIELIQIFVFHIHQDWINWVVVLIFCGYIGYDWGRANRIPKTIDNAVDSAAQIYIDVLNLFFRGRKRRL